MSMHDTNKCPSCKHDLRGKEIPAEHRHCYNHGPNGEFLNTAEEYAAIEDQLDNPITHFSRVIGCEYPYEHPDRYDGVSEWQCPDCGYREGRWSGKALADNESEPRGGGNHA